jgi:hypothetical protein
MVLGVTSAVVRTWRIDCSGAFWIEMGNIIHPFDEEETLWERKLGRNGSEVRPINVVKLGVGPVVASMKGGTLSLFADESSDRARELAIDGDIVNCDSNLADREELYHRSLYRRSGGGSGVVRGRVRRRGFRPLSTYTTHPTQRITFTRWLWLPICSP